MIVHQQEHNFELPGGELICVKQLDSAHARGTEDVMASGWQRAYEVPGLITPEVSRIWVDAESEELCARLAGRISEGKGRLRDGDRTGALYLGAFTAAADSEHLVQIGMLKYRQSANENVFAASNAWDMPEGEIDEMDVQDGWPRRGVGRAMVYVALLHANELDHATFRLSVVKRNTQAIWFYRHQLGMVEAGDAVHVPSMPRSMDRVKMRGLVRRSQKQLTNLNPWLLTSR